MCTTWRLELLSFELGRPRRRDRARDVRRIRRIQQKSLLLRLSARLVHRGESVVFTWTSDKGVYHTGGLCVSRFLFRTISLVQTPCPYETQTGWVGVACACRPFDTPSTRSIFFSLIPNTWTCALPRPVIKFPRHSVSSDTAAVAQRSDTTCAYAPIASPLWPHRLSAAICHIQL